MTILWPLPPVHKRPLFRMGMILAAVTLVLDQATKLWVLHLLELPGRIGGKVELSPIFDLTYVENRGISFGLLAGGMASRVFLSLVSIVVSVFIVRWLAKTERRFSAIAAGLILGGAVGNLIDRVFYGYVVDFLDFSGIGFGYVFNVADAAINIGVAFLLYDWLVVERRERAGSSSG
ncbi:signal peptidase II [Parvularcula maris]|uniref:Lipoprotein signal peptidase n=1 Tax=Parvularcula maris TaxID=2965077 RepID=A0A9X2L6Z3_9PROT|nr:signal peptidase II [Parvularcula maris]MCQ8184190.1 signal peptidase II [Parvularcula maris]